VIVTYSDVPVADIKGRIIRNANYGGVALINGWTWRPLPDTRFKPQFQKALIESMGAEGMRNPIIVYALPEGDFLSFGGSRLRAAMALEWETVPCLVNDYVDRHEGPEVTPDNYKQFFTDVPEFFEFNEHGIDYHYSLERNRRDHYDEAGMRWAEGADFIATEFEWIKG